jgi:Fuc2NAc and GlcNAc transferase
MMMSVLLLLAASLILGAGGALFISRYGSQLGLMDIPTDRSSHLQPVSKGGGVGILCSFLIAAIGLQISPALWGPVVALSVVSLFGDKYDLSVRNRLAVQFGVAFFVLVVGELIKDMSLLGTSSSFFSMAFGIAFFMVFMVGTANYYNFMDGINGIAAVTGIAAFGLLAWYAFDQGRSHVLVLLSLSLVSACIGFLPFNMPKARVFMGDVGSILLGFVFAGMVIALSENMTEFIALAACLFPFYADEITTTIVRVRNGERLSQPHRRHLYQLLANEMGIDHWKISIGYCVIQIIVGCSLLPMIRHGFWAITLLLIFYFMVFSIMSLRVRKYVGSRK